MVDTSDEWITHALVSKERRRAAKDEFTSDMAAKAAQRAMKMAGVTGDQIQLIIVATITPDMPFPATACLVQHKIGAKRAAAFDLEAACSGFHLRTRSRATIHHVAHLRHGSSSLVRKKLSSIVNWKDRNTCVLSATAQARRFCKTGKFTRTF